MAISNSRAKKFSVSVLPLIHLGEEVSGDADLGVQGLEGALAAHELLGLRGLLRWRAAPPPPPPAAAAAAARSLARASSSWAWAGAADDAGPRSRATSERRLSTSAARRWTSARTESGAGGGRLLLRGQGRRAQDEEQGQRAPARAGYDWGHFLGIGDLLGAARSNDERCPERRGDGSGFGDRRGAAAVVRQAEGGARGWWVTLVGARSRRGGACGHRETTRPRWDARDSRTDRRDGVVGPHLHAQVVVVAGGAMADRARLLDGEARARARHDRVWG